MVPKLRNCLARLEQYTLERKEFIKQEKFRNGKTCPRHIMELAYKPQDLSLKLNQTKSNLEDYVDTQREGT